MKRRRKECGISFMWISLAVVVSYFSILQILVFERQYFVQDGSFTAKRNLNFISVALPRNRQSSMRSVNFTKLSFAALVFAVPQELWPPSRNLMVNSSPDLQWKLLNSKIIYITYGEHCCASSLARACAAALANGTVNDCRAFDASVLDPVFFARHKRTLAIFKGAGLWLWKPYIINRTLYAMDEGDYLVYADAGVYMSGPIHPLLVLLERLDEKYKGVLLFGTGIAQRYFCKRDAFVRQGCDTRACHDAYQVNGAISVWRRGPHALRVAETWLRECEDYQVSRYCANIFYYSAVSVIVSAATR